MLRIRLKSTLSLSRSFGSTPAIRKFKTEYTPAPPKLPKEQQEEFENLQRIAQSQSAIEEYNRKATEESVNEGSNELKTDIGNFHPQFFKTVPEFEGDVNPITGERGGPKQDPLKHGSDWSYNGRVTDF